MVKTAEQFMRALTFYGLNLFAPNGEERPETRWLARTHDGAMMGFGPSPLEAVQNAVETREVLQALAPSEDDDWDFLN